MGIEIGQRKVLLISTYLLCALSVHFSTSLSLCPLCASSQTQAERAKKVDKDAVVKRLFVTKKKISKADHEAIRRKARSSRGRWLDQATGAVGSEAFLEGPKLKDEEDK